MSALEPYRVWDSGGRVLYTEGASPADAAHHWALTLRDTPLIVHVAADSAPADVSHWLVAPWGEPRAVDPNSIEPALVQAIGGALGMRLEIGRRGYGDWHLDDSRDLVAEALEEVLDAVAYLMAAVLRGAR